MTTEADTDSRRINPEQVRATMGRLLRNHETRFVALQQWPGERTRNRSRSNFSAAFAKTADLLDRELHYLKAKHVVIQMDCEESQIRIEGTLRAKAQLRSPGLILTFESKYGPQNYPCDTFTDWHDNLRAIALALEALRTVDRYGVTKRGEQYKGWKALTFRGDDYFANPQEAATFLAGEGWKYGSPAQVLSSADTAKSVYKQRASENHPDHNGSAEVFKRITAAWEIVRAWHERRKIGQPQLARAAQ